jgi:hypothetical protein
VKGFTNSFFRAIILLKGSGLPIGGLSFQVVTPLSVVDLPESYKDALAGVTGTFQASFQPISLRLEAFGKVFQPTTLNGGTTSFQEVKS